MITPICIHLRKLKLESGKAIHVFWNKRRTISGTVRTGNRNKAKAAIRDLNKDQELDFFR